MTDLSTPAGRLRQYFLDQPVTLPGRDLLLLDVAILEQQAKNLDRALEDIAHWPSSPVSPDNDRMVSQDMRGERKP